MPQTEIDAFRAKAEAGRRIVTEMSDAAAYEQSESLQNIVVFAVWQQNSQMPDYVKVQTIRVAIEAAYRLGQMNQKEY